MIPSAASGPVSKPTQYESLKDALKVGLRAHYSKTGETPGQQTLTETTTSASFPASLPERPLGGLSRRTHHTKGAGIALKQNVSEMERALEKTFLTLRQNQRKLGESNVGNFLNRLADSLYSGITSGDIGVVKQNLRNMLQEIDVMESQSSSPFIGAMAPETTQPLGRQNPGDEFRSMMGESNQLVEMIANQIASGAPKFSVMGSIKASYRSTNNPNVREILERAASVIERMHI